MEDLLDRLRAQLLGSGGKLGEAVNAKAGRARQLDAAVDASVVGQPPVAAAQSPQPGQGGGMSQSQFFQARTPEERMRQQQALAAKLRAMGQ